MTEDKRQERADVAERLRGIKLDPDGNSHARLSAICGAIRRPAYAWTRGACENVVRTLIDLLTDDDAVDDCGQIADMSQKGGDCVRSEGEIVRETPIFTEIPQKSPERGRECAPDDTREKLEADANALACDYWDKVATWDVANDFKRDVMALLDRQAAITERECMPKSMRRFDSIETACGIAEKEAEIERLQRTVDELTAENDALREWKVCYKQAKDDSDHWQRMVGELRDRVRELENELANMTGARDHWQRVAGKHAEELGKLRDRERDLEAELEVMRTKQAMPKGVVWPHFEDGACVGIGDEFVGCDGEPHELACVKFLDDGYWMMEGTSDQGGVGFGGFTALGCGFWSYGETFERAPLLASDGEPIEVGQVLYGLSDGKAWTVTSIDRSNSKYPILGESEVEQFIQIKQLKPEWLSHGRPDSWEDVAATVRAWREVDPDETRVTVMAYALDDLAERIEKLAKEGA